MQESDLIPYHCETLSYKRALVLAPHPDDEVFGCGGTTAKLAASGTSILQLILTDGSLGGPMASEELVSTRQAESSAAAKALGIVDTPVFWGLPDRQLIPNQAIWKRLTSLTDSFAPEVIFAPSPLEVHPDHRSTAWLAEQLWLWLGKNQGNQNKKNQTNDVALVFYEVGQTLHPNLLVDISEQIDRKRKAMLAFESQLSERPYDEVFEGLHRYRSYTVEPAASYVEAFFRLKAHEPLPTSMYRAQRAWASLHSLKPFDDPEPSNPNDHQATERFQAWTGTSSTAGNDEETIAIIVRTQWRESLARTIQSLINQEGVAPTVILVAASPPDSGALVNLKACSQALRILHSHAKDKAFLSRVDAINTGIETALATNAQFFGFLDDDDVIHPHHLVGLIQALKKNPHFIAAYAGVRLIDETQQVIKTLHETWDAHRLLRANFLPIHAVLFRRSLIEDREPLVGMPHDDDSKYQGPVRADPQFDLYEDWDFWLQASERGEFLRVDQISADYLQSEQSLAASEQLEAERLKAREAIYNKWLTQAPLRKLAAALRIDELDIQASRQALSDAKAHIALLESDLQHLQRSQALDQSKWHQYLETLHQERRELEKLVSEGSDQIARLEVELLSRTAELQQMRIALSEAHADKIAAIEYQQRMHEKALDESRHQYEASAAKLRSDHEASAGKLRSEVQTIEAALHREHIERVHLNQEVKRLHLEVAGREQSLQLMRKSLSWQVTVPVRLAGKLSRLVYRQLYPFARMLIKPLAKAVGIPHPRVWWRSKFSRSTSVDAFAAPRRDQITDASLAPTLMSDKETFKAQAQADLARWLAQGQRLDLSELRTTDATQPTRTCISIVLVLYNQAGLTKRCLDSVLAHGRAKASSADIEVILVDNASSDLTNALLERIDGAVILRYQENLGFIRAVNAASDKATGDYLLLLNNDAELIAGSLDAALERLTSDESIQAVGGPVLLLDGSLQEAGNIIWSDASCLGYGRGQSPDADKFQHVRNVDYVSGAFMLTPLARFRALGKLDERFAPAYYEESDYCARLWQQGFRVVYEPRARIRHFEFASSESSDWAIAQQRKNQGLFQAKHREWLKQQAAMSPKAWQGPTASEREQAIQASALLACSRPRTNQQKRARILVLDDRVPHVHLGSGFPRSRDMVIALAEAGHEVCFLPVTFPSDHWEEIRKTLAPDIEVALNIGAAGLGAFVLERAAWITHLLVSRPHNMSFLRPIWRTHPDLFKRWHKVYDAEAIFSYRDAALAKLKGNPYNETKLSKSLQDELSLAHGVDAITAVSTHEAESFRKLLKTPTEVLGHQIEIRATRTEFERRQGILFVGALYEDNTPNTESMVWFIDEVMPRLKERFQADGNLHLDLVGHCKAPAILERQAPWLRIHGPVDDLGPYFEQAKLFVVPTRFAAGMPHKAHEAASRGLPMVVSSLIASQLAWDHREVKIADQPEDFANACAELMTDQDQWQGLRDRALASIQRDCDPKQFRHALFKAMRLTPA